MSIILTVKRGNEKRNLYNHIIDNKNYPDKSPATCSTKVPSKKILGQWTEQLKQASWKWLVSNLQVQSSGSRTH